MMANNFEIDLNSYTISGSTNAFGINFFKTLNDTNGGNKIISPILLSTAIGMLHLGSKGETNNELRQLLGYSKYNITDEEAHRKFKILLGQLIAKESNNELSFANRVMVQKNYNIEDDYKNLLLINYNATLEEVDFLNDGLEAIKSCNKWVACETKERITSFFKEPLPQETKLVILNALYFKGKWSNMFNPEKTYKTSFINFGISETSVQMMYKGYSKYKFFSCSVLNADILELPFIEGSLCMYIILPHDLKGLSKTISSLNEQNLNFALCSMLFCTVCLYLPKFIIETSFPLVEEFKSLGIKNIFTDNADLSGINCQKKLKMSEIVHKILIEVNEEGSEAVAATGVVTTDSICYIPNSIYFKVDHPFIYMIRDNKNNLILFIGQITHL